MPTLYLIFNHKLTPEQESDAREKLDVSEFVYLPEDLQDFWSQVPPEGELDIESLRQITSWLEENAKSDDFVLIQGDFGATFWLVDWCLAHALVPVYATTCREAVETQGHSGVVEKRLVFRHVGFRKYKRCNTLRKVIENE